MKKLVKKLSVVMISTILVTACFAGCGSKAQPENVEETKQAADAAIKETTEAAEPVESAELAKENMKLGVSWCTMAAPAVKYVANGSTDRAKEIGVELVSLDAQNDAQKQTDQVRNLITQKVDAIILNPVDSKSIVPVVKEAFEAGIPVIMAAINIDASGEEYITSFVGADEVQSGSLAGDLMKEALGDKGGQVAIIEGAAGAISAAQRTQGFEESVKSNSNIEIVAKQPTASWDRAEAMAIMEDLLVKYPDLNAVYTHDDNMAIGAITAIKAANRMNDIKVVGIGATQDGVDAVKAGELYGAIEFPLGDGGKTYIDTAVSAIKGETVEKWVKDNILAITQKNVEGYEPKY